VSGALLIHGGFVLADLSASHWGKSSSMAIDDGARW
jgi:hypothetical protein